MTAIFSLLAILFALLLAPVAAGVDGPSDGRIKVFLFAAPAFTSEVSVDVFNNTCFSLDNNLIDGSVKSILVGGRDVTAVMNRHDDWYCMFYDNYDCTGGEENMLFIPDGANNLASAGWAARIHSIQCLDDDP